MSKDKLGKPPKSSKEIFAQYMSGDSGALALVLEAEQPGLFDYLVRMTADQAKAIESIDEVFSVIASRTYKFRDLNELKIRLYSTARSFNADSWNTDTRALECPPPSEEQAGGADYEVLRELHRSLCFLPAWEREPVILKDMKGFTMAEVAQIMGMGLESVNSSYQEAQKNFRTRHPKVHGAIESLFKVMPNYELPEGGHYKTKSLSIIIEDIEKTRVVKRRSPLKFLFFGILFGIIVYLLFHFRII